MDLYNIHEKYMSRAIYLAKKGQGKVSPNPMVGCVIVKNGEIIGEGYHKQFGGAHAEVAAFKNCIKDPTDGAIYVTLEPCSHHGKTGPCCNVIVENGIRDAYVSMLDPNKEVNGKGIEHLKNSGINVQCDILKDEAKNLNKGYLHWIKTKTPLVIGKLAQDDRGFIAKKGSKVWITGASSKQSSHQLRSEVDAILVGKNTVLIDDPELTVREVIGYNPKRIVLDTNRTLPYNFKLLNDNEAHTIIMCSNNKFQDNETSHCQYLVVDEKNNKLDPKSILNRLGDIGVTSLIIEGGASTIKSFLDMELIDQFYLYTSPSSKDELDIKNPFLINDDWQVQDEKFLDDDHLIIFKKREECLQEL
tara:strand:- start:1203 stop:2282 length:1080 start_codon:yes stop_codon:yes gene_type:complete